MLIGLADSARRLGDDSPHRTASAENAPRKTFSYVGSLELITTTVGRSFIVDAFNCYAAETSVQIPLHLCMHLYLAHCQGVLIIALHFYIVSCCPGNVLHSSQQATSHWTMV